MNKLVAASLLSLLLLASCGKKSKQETPYSKDPSQPLVDLNTDKDPSSITPDPTPAPAPTPVPTPEPLPPSKPLPGPIPLPKPRPPQAPKPQPAPAPTPAPAPVPDPVPVPAPAPDHPTKYCDKGAHDKEYPEGTNTSNGSRNGYDFGIGGGCIRRAIKDVLQVSLNRKLMVWDDVDESSYLQYAPPEHVNFFFTVKYIVHKIITVDWDMDWYYSVKAGSLDDPQKILINYKKVKGTSHISYWEGSIILDRVNDHVTSFAMLNQIEADQNTAKDAEDAVKDVYRKLHDGNP